MKNRFLAGIALAFGIFTATGCSSVSENETVVRACPFDQSTQTGTSACIQATAAEFYEYAVLAVLAYEQKQSDANADSGFTLPAGFIEASSCSDVSCDGAGGYQYKVFHRIRDGALVEKVISFRGTDQKFWDWIVTNTFGSRAQNAAALATYHAVLGDSSIPVSVVGDSLGGALAIQVSICTPVFRRVALNTSPRFYKNECSNGRSIAPSADIYKTHQLLIEKGEFLQAVRLFAPNSNQLYTAFNCIRGFGPASQHNVKRLAACIITRAKQSGSVAAQTYYNDNRTLIDSSVETR